MARGSAVKKKVTREQVIKVIKFARDNKCLITPVGMSYSLEGFAMFQACPCDTKRLTCPCEQSLEEIKRDGHCLCRLFFGIIKPS